MVEKLIFFHDADEGCIQPLVSNSSQEYVSDRLQDISGNVSKGGLFFCTEEGIVESITRRKDLLNKLRNFGSMFCFFGEKPKLLSEIDDVVNFVETELYIDVRYTQQA